MPQRNDLSRSLVAFRQDGTPVAVAEPRRSSRLVAGTAPGIGRHTLKKLDPSEEALFAPLRRWRDEDGRGGAYDHPPILPAEVVGAVVLVRVHVERRPRQVGPTPSSRFGLPGSSDGTSPLRWP